MRKSLIPVSLAVLVGASGCGGGGGGGSVRCDAFSACGGSVVGTWNIVKWCVSTTDAGTTKTDASASSCSTTTNGSTMSFSGTLTFGTDGTYTMDLRMTGTAEFTYSPDCLTGTSCSQFTSYLNADAGTSWSCSTGSTGSCTCTETLSDKASRGQGTYTTSGSSISMTSSDLSEYCVRGNTLMLHLSSGDNSATLIATR
jgi:hypothetical protein